VVRRADHLRVPQLKSPVGAHVHGNDVVDDLRTRQLVGLQTLLAESVIEVTSVVRYGGPRRVVTALGGRSTSCVAPSRVRATVDVTERTVARSGAAGIAADGFEAERHSVA